MKVNDRDGQILQHIEFIAMKLIIQLKDLEKVSVLLKQIIYIVMLFQCQSCKLVN